MEEIPIPKVVQIVKDVDPELERAERIRAIMEADREAKKVGGRKGRRGRSIETAGSVSRSSEDEDYPHYRGVVDDPGEVEDGGYTLSDGEGDVQEWDITGKNKDGGTRVGANGSDKPRTGAGDIGLEKAVWERNKGDGGESQNPGSEEAQGTATIPKRTFRRRLVLEEDDDF